MQRRVLVIGGSGALGAAVLSELARLKVQSRFTFYHNREQADRLSRQYALAAHACDLTHNSQPAALIEELSSSNWIPNTIIDCAAMYPGTDQQSSRALETGHASAALALAQALAPLMHEGGDFVYTCGYASHLATEIAPTYELDQAALARLPAVLAKEYGRENIRFNSIGIGLMTRGISSRFPVSIRDQFTQFSALRRPAEPIEVARAVVWLALQNSYMNGKVFAVNGGI